METTKGRPRYLRGDPRTAGQLRSAGGDPLLLPEYTTKRVSWQISVLRPMLALAWKRGDWAILLSLAGLAGRWEGQR